MLKENVENSKNKIVKLYGLVTALNFILLFVFMAILSLIMVVFGIDKGWIPFFTSFSLATSTFISSFFLGKGIGKKSIIVGSVYAIWLYLIVSIISAVIAGGKISLSSLFNFLIIFLASLVGAVFGANAKNKRKI